MTRPPVAELPPPASLPEALELVEWYARRDASQVRWIEDLINEVDMLTKALIALTVTGEKVGSEWTRVRKRLAQRKREAVADE
ncbi:MAG: hypothetical protein ACE5HE_08850 [Phycisphaerae bacterium]